MNHNLSLSHIYNRRDYHLNPDQKYMLILLLSFIISRLVIYRFIPFRFNTLFYYLQYLEPDILRHDLWQGLWHLHSQPPLFNLFLGLVLKISPSGIEDKVFAALYSALGVVIMLAGYTLMRYLRVSKTLAFLVSLLLMLLPPIVQAERWLFYPYLLTAALLLSAIFLYRFIYSGKIIYLILFSASAAGIVLTRSFFHLVFWMLPITIMLLLLIASRDDPPVDRRSSKSFWLYLGISVFFLLIASSIYFKNYFQFGLFTSSTWQGMNFSAMTSYVNQTDIEKLVASGEITPMALIPRFSPPDTYYEYYNRTQRDIHPTQSGIRALDDTVKSSGAINGNNRIYGEISKEYQQNTFTILKHFPKSYLKAVINGIYIFFGLEPYRFFWNYSEWGRPRKDSLLHTTNDILLNYVVPFLLALIFMAVVLTMTGGIVRGMQQPGKGTGGKEKAAGKAAQYALYAYIVFNLLYVFTVANMVEFGEGCFMRMPIDPFLAAGFALILDRIIHHDRRPAMPMYHKR